MDDLRRDLDGGSASQLVLFDLPAAWIPLATDLLEGLLYLGVCGTVL